MDMPTDTKALLCGAAKFAPALAAVAVMGSIASAAPGAPVPPNGELGFVVVQFHTAVYIGDPKADCPDGMLGVLKDDYLRTQPPAERSRLLLKENEPELQKAWQAYGGGPNNTNICSNVYEFPDRPPTNMNKGKVAYGFNLDNDETGAGNDSYTCKHDNFSSPTGEKGIDHQLWRVRGCSDGYRGVDESGLGENRKGLDDMMMTGQLTQVILLRGVNSLVNDPDVEVVYANTDDRPTVDSRGKPIFKASFTVSTLGKKVEYRNVLHGHITNGVLETDTKDILLNGTGSEFDLAHGRLRLEFQPDGTAKGMVGGYMPLLHIMGSARGGGRGSVNVAGINCAGQFTALRMMADGDKDPKTGQCRKISYAYELFAVPAFVNDVPPRQMAKK
jgi:hypothetical protein